MVKKETEINKSKSIIGLFVVAIIWGSTFTGNKIALDDLTPLTLMAVRFMLAFIFMLVIFRKKFVNIKIKDCVGGIICGICLFTAFVLQTYGLLYTEAGKQAFLSGAYVIAVPFLAWIVFKKRPKLSAYISSFLCFYGISLLSFNPGMTINKGDTLTIVSSFLFAAHIIIISHYIKKDEPAVMTTIQFGVMGALSLLGVILMRDNSAVFFLNNPFSITSLAIIYLALFGTTIAYYLQILCQKQTNPTTTSIILSMETVFGALISFILLREIFTTRMILGAMIIFISVLISEVEIDFKDFDHKIRSKVIKLFNKKDVSKEELNKE